MKKLTWAFDRSLIVQGMLKQVQHDKTLTSGTDITFEVRASDTVFLKGDGTPAWQDASVLPTGRYQQWRATLTTTDGANTPVLHEVWDLYSW
ncbi:MAG: hypothetical protein KAS54_07405 [Dehalococcoidia bacterium]|nr:hypothetical protein [Dehalococcoidia bacterium]